MELKVEIFGRVQGVMFRHFVKETADRFKVKGYVMNKKEGSVLTVAQGEKKVLEDFLKEISEGPALAKVEGVSYFWKKNSEKFKDFEIKVEKSFVKDQKSSFINLGKKILGIKDKTPKHVAIIPDGNRRWARARKMVSTEGHRIAGSTEHLKELLEEARSLGVNYLTFWVFSTENWKRDKKEVDKLLKLFVEMLNKVEKDFIENKIRFRHLGRRDRLPAKLVKLIERVEKSTKSFKEFNLQICMDYGGRDEIVRALNKALRAGVQEVKEDDFVSFLDTHEIPDPDLVIRTSGENRLSGFMPFQSTYSEFYFTDVHFPDFGADEFRNAVEEFVNRRRRFGGN